MARFRRVVALVWVSLMMSVGSPELQAAPNLAILETFSIEDAGEPRTINPMVLSPDGQQLYGVAYITNSTGGIEIHLLSIGVATRRVVGKLNLGLGGFVGDLAVTPDGRKAYISIRGIINTSTPQLTPPRVEVVDVSQPTLSADTTIFTGGDRFGPNGAALTPDGRRLYLAHLGERSVFVIDTGANSIINTVPIGSTQGTGVAISPDGSRAVVVDRGNGALYVIDTSTEARIVTIPTTNPTGGNVFGRLVVSPDGRQVYSAHAASPVLTIFDIHPSSPTFHQQADTIVTSGSRFVEIAFDVERRLILGADPLDKVLLFDVDPSSPTYHTEVGSIVFPTGASPRDIVIAPGPDPVVFVSLSDGEVAVIGNAALRPDAGLVDAAEEDAGARRDAVPIRTLVLEDGCGCGTTSRALQASARDAAAILAWLFWVMTRTRRGLRRRHRC